MKTCDEKRKKITVLIPCYNEAGGIGAVIKSFPREQIEKRGFDLDIRVINNNSNDGTADIAHQLGVTVINESKKGKGNAIRAGFYSIGEDTDYVVMLDGDNTYRPEEILRMVEPLHSDFCTVVIGSRLGGRIVDGSMTVFNRAGNWAFSHLVRYFYRVNVTDVLTGYYAWKRDSLIRLRPCLMSTNFSIEMEMVTKMARLGEEICCVPITYDSREGASHLNPITDGLRILWMFTKNLLWEPAVARPQRIVFVSDSIMPYTNGGKEKRLYEIATRLAKKGNDVHIYTMHWWNGPKTVMHDGVHYHALCKYHPLYSGDRRSIREALAFGFAALKLLFVRFDVLDVDHMPQFALFGARLITWMRGKKLYATWHEVWGREYWLGYLGGLLGIFGYIVERLSLTLPDVIVSNSEHTTRRLHEVGVRKKIETVPLGADLQSIYSVRPGEIKSDVIFVGRLLNHKGADLLVRAIAKVKILHPHIRSLVVGVGPEKENISKLISKLGLEENITLLGAVAGHENLYGLMKSSKLLVLPSIREGFGLVVVEANAAGLPVVTTRYKDNAAQDLIEEGVNGFLAEPTADAFAEKINKILHLRSQMHPQNGIEKYDWHVVVQNLERVYMSVLKLVPEKIEL
ncbi:MAG: glycosyltransferase [bacterium]|nr:glycosyltransferase [bacterium]